MKQELKELLERKRIIMVRNEFSKPFFETNKNELFDINRAIDHELDKIKEPYLKYIGKKGYFNGLNSEEYVCNCHRIHVNEDYETVSFVFRLQDKLIITNTVKWLD